MPELNKFTLVHIRGLQSEAAKKFNDGLGVIISNKATTDDKGVTRYAVRIFALPHAQVSSPRDVLEKSGHWTILKRTADKKLKEENLDPRPQGGPGGKEARACLINAAKNYYGGTSDNKIALFWLEANLTACPEDYKSAMDIVNTLSMTGRVSEAAKVGFIVSPFIDETDYVSGVLLVKIFCDAQVHMEEAVRLALTIPVNTQKAFRIDVLGKIVDRLYVTLRQVGFTKPEVAQLHLTAGKAYYELFEEDASRCEKLALQHYLAGEYWEAVKLHRKAIRLGLPVDITKSLIQCQLHCPGMRLENYFVVWQEDDLYTCVPKGELHKMGYHSATGAVYAKDIFNDDPTVQFHFETPTDPDDPEVFGELLERLRLEEEQGEG